MKKLLCVFIVITLVCSMAACAATNESIKEVPSAVCSAQNPEGIYDTTVGQDVSITSGNNTIFPYFEFYYSTTYQKDGGWLAADGVWIRIEEIKDQLPQLTLGDDITMNILNNGYRGFDYDVFNSKYEEVCQHNKNFDTETLQSFGSGTYYIRILTFWRGKYIDDKFESYGNRYLFKLTIR